MNIIRQTSGAVKHPSSPPHPLYTPNVQSKERQSEEQSKVARVRRGMGYYKHLVGSARAIVSEFNISDDYKRTIMGTIAKTIDGKVIDRDEFLMRLSSLRGEIEARAPRESRSDLCYWLKRRLFPQRKLCTQCRTETDSLIEGLCSRCYWEVIR